MNQINNYKGTLGGKLRNTRKQMIDHRSEMEILKKAEENKKE